MIQIQGRCDLCRRLGTLEYFNVRSPNKYIFVCAGRHSDNWGRGSCWAEARTNDALANSIGKWRQPRVAAAELAPGGLWSSRPTDIVDAVRKLNEQAEKNAGWAPSNGPTYAECREEARAALAAAEPAPEPTEGDDALAFFKRSAVRDC